MFMGLKMNRIVKDSSIWGNSNAYLEVSNTNEIKIGIVRSQEYVKETDSYIYVVEALGNGRRVMMRCNLMSRFGDVYNYEEWTPRFNLVSTSEGDPEPWDYKVRAGEVVLVTMVDGGHMDGVILGSMKHPARKSKLKEGEYSYSCQYNGIETTIDKDGAWKITFKGIPTNEKDLYKDTKNGIKEAEYDKELMGTFIGIDKDGSIELNDFNSSELQKINIDKKEGKINIVSGSVSLVIDKKANSVKVNSETTNIESSKSVTVKTADFLVNANKTTKIKSPKIAIGYNGTELIDSIIQLVDAVGSLIINAPNGPCSPFKTASTWSQIESIKSKLNSIKGSL
jgi:hypothetical protein